MNSYQIRTVAVMVLQEGDELFGETATEIRIISEGSGEFLEVSQVPDSGKQTLRIAPEEWPTLREAIDRMFTECSGAK